MATASVDAIAQWSQVPVELRRVVAAHDVLADHGHRYTARADRPHRQIALGRVDIEDAVTHVRAFEVALLLAAVAAPFGREHDDACVTGLEPRIARLEHV